MLTLLSLFLASKIIHLVHLGLILGGDMDLYREENEEIMQAYPNSDDFNVRDKGIEDLQADCHRAIVQYLMVILINAILLLLTKRTSYYIVVLAWVIGVV